MHPQYTDAQIARFWSHVNRTDACWLWTAAPLSDGYGAVTINYRHWRAHRLAWNLATGSPPPDGHLVCHTCDVPLCVRNDDEGTYEVNGLVLPRRGHLFLAPSTWENMTDMVLKGRIPSGAQHPRHRYPGRYVAGADCPWARLTHAQVATIRQRYAAGGITQDALAAEYGVRQSTISSVVQGTRYKSS